MPKRVTIIVVLAVFAAVFWTVARLWVGDPAFGLAEYQAWLWPLVALIVLSASAVWAFLLLADRRWRISASLAVAGPSLIVFGLRWEWLVSIVIMGLLHARAIQKLDTESRARVDMNPRRLAGAGVGTVLLSLMLVLSFAYYLNPDVQASATSRHLPAPITQAIEKAARQAAAIQFSEASPSERNQIAGQVARELISRITAWVRPYSHYFPPILAFGLFLALEAFSFIIIPLASLAAWGIFIILKYTRFIIIEERDIKAQTIRLADHD